MRRAAEPGGLPSLLRRPGAAGFRRLLAADVVSPVGDAMGTVALILHLQRVQGTGTAVATVLVAESLPPLLSPWLGALADRHPGRRTLVACALAQGLVMVVMAAWLPGLAGLFAFMLVRALFAAIASPVAGAALPALVEDDDLPSANALLGGGRELGTIVGPPLAGLLFAVAGGVRTVLLVDAVTFFAVVPLVAGLRLPSRPTPTPDAPRATVRADAWEGMRALWRTPVLRALAVAFWLAVLVSAGDDLVLPFLAQRDLGAGPLGIGVLLAGASVGLVLGLFALARTRVRWTPFVAVLAGFALTAVGNLLTGFAPVLAVAVGTQVVRGTGIALVEAHARTLVQRTAPRELLGRVLANLYGGVSVAAALSYVIGGPLLDATSPRFVLAAIGLGGLAAVALGALLSRGAGRDEGAP